MSSDYFIITWVFWFSLCHTGLPTKDETSETISREKYCLFHYIHAVPCCFNLVAFYVKSPYKPVKEYMQGRSSSRHISRVLSRLYSLFFVGNSVCYKSKNKIINGKLKTKLNCFSGHPVSLHFINYFGTLCKSTFYQLFATFWLESWPIRWRLKEFFFTK